MASNAQVWLVYLFVLVLSPFPACSQWMGLYAFSTDHLMALDPLSNGIENFPPLTHYTPLNDAAAVHLTAKVYFLVAHPKNDSTTAIVVGVHMDTGKLSSVTTLPDRGVLPSQLKYTLAVGYGWTVFVTIQYNKSIEILNVNPFYEPHVVSIKNITVDSDLSLSPSGVSAVDGTLWLNLQNSVIGIDGDNGALLYTYTFGDTDVVSALTYNGYIETLLCVVFGKNNVTLVELSATVASPEKNVLGLIKPSNFTLISFTQVLIQPAFDPSNTLLYLFARSIDNKNWNWLVVDSENTNDITVLPASCIEGVGNNLLTFSEVGIHKVVSEQPTQNQGEFFCPINMFYLPFVF